MGIAAIHFDFDFDVGIKERTTTKIDMWYDPHIRLWTLTPMDDENYQTGDCQYAYGKKDAMRMKKEMEMDLL